MACLRTAVCPPRPLLRPMRLEVTGGDREAGPRLLFSLRTRHLIVIPSSHAAARLGHPVKEAS